MKEGYVEKKIHNCMELVENATSNAQREVYQGYLEFWQDKHKDQIIKPKEPKEPEEVPEEIPEEESDEIEFESEPALEFDDKSINEYEEATGRKAIWKGVITNGFKEFLKELKLEELLKSKL